MWENFYRMLQNQATWLGYLWILYTECPEHSGWTFLVPQRTKRTRIRMGESRASYFGLRFP